MDVLLHQAAFVKYFSSLTLPLKSAEDILIANIINNSNNKFLFNGNFESQIRAQIDQANPIFDVYQQFIQNFINSSIISLPSSGAQTDDEELIKMNSHYNNVNKVAKQTTYVRIGYTTNPSLKAHDFAFFDTISKPNFDWACINLAANNPNSITVRYNDFRTVADVKRFLDSIYKLANSISYINVLDRYKNIGHSLFDWFIGKSTIEYLTLRGEVIELKQFQKDLRNKFKKAFIYTTSRQYLHERKLFFSDLIIEFDDDFHNIDPGQPNWKIDITCCSITFNQFKEKKNLRFKKFQ